MGYRPSCPECKGPLSFIVEEDKETGGINIIVICSLCDEYQGFTIKTGIKNRDFSKLAKTKEPFKMEVEIIPQPNY